MKRKPKEQKHQVKPYLQLEETEKAGHALFLELCNDSVKWGHLPALRRLFDQEPIPSHYGKGLGLQWAAEIAVVAKKHEDRILEKREPNDLLQLCEDLKRLKWMLSYAASFFQDHAERVRGLSTEVEEQIYRQRREEDLQQRKSNGEQG